MATPEPGDLTREKTLFSLWLTSFKFRGRRKFNALAALAVALGLIAYCWLAWKDANAALAAFRRLEATGLTVAVAILGFLVAGFTIFVTVTNTSLSLAMAKMEKEKTGESWLKYNLSAFIVTFAHYITYVFACLLCELFAQPGGLVSLAYAKALSHPALAAHLPAWRAGLSAAALIVFGTWTAYVVLLLKSFIYNVYAVATNSIRFSWEEDERAKAAEAEKANQNARHCDSDRSRTAEGTPLSGE